MARDGFSTILISPEEIKILDSSDIIIDISPRSTEYIPGAISIPYDRFIDPAGRLEPIGEMARILGRQACPRTIRSSFMVNASPAAAAPQQPPTSSGC